MRATVRSVLAVAWPVMLSYVAVGLACGVLEAQTGMEPWMAFALGATVLSGAGQFMISNLWLAGVPLVSVAASTAAISTRFALYSASLAPYLARSPRALALAVSATLTEEAFGISLSKLAACEEHSSGDVGSWSAAHALLLNLVLLFTWASSCAVGVMLGAAVDIPTAIAGFAMTSLFICLLVSQKLDGPGAIAAGAAAVCVVALKAAGLASAAVPVAAVAGVACAMLFGALRRRVPDAAHEEGDAR